MTRVLLQMGHCFRTTGATGTNGVDGDPNEQEFAHLTCNRAAALLTEAGHQATVIHADEPDSAYQGYDAFFAVHADGSTSETARGASVGYRTDEGAQLAAWFKQAYHDLGWSGFRPDNYTKALAGYYGVREAVAQGCRSAVIVEAGFLTSPADEALLSPPDGPDRVARAITDAVVAIWGRPNNQPEDDMLAVSLARDPRDGKVYQVVDFTDARHLASEDRIFIAQAYWQSKGVKAADLQVQDWDPADLDPIIAHSSNAAAPLPGPVDPPAVPWPVVSGEFTGTVTLAPTAE